MHQSNSYWTATEEIVHIEARGEVNFLVMATHKSELIIALFDVLGFEERIRTFSLEEVHGQYKDLLAIANTKGSHAFFDARPAGDGTFVPYFGHITVDQDYFSDTILLWSRFNAATL